MSDQDKQVVLSVDDEVNIGKAIKRTLRKIDAEVLLANSGKEALKIVSNRKVDVILSDMRMPEMDGAEFLSKAKEIQPNSRCILLTGYADLSGVVAAVNDGGISNYLSKPWDDAHLVQVVNESLNLVKVKNENEQLHKDIEIQNTKLNELNATLEDKVSQRTEDLQLANDSLQVAMEELNQNYEAMVDLSANLAALPHSESITTGKKIVLALAIGKEVKLDEHELIDLRRATRLHRLGWAAMPHGLTDKPLSQFSSEEVQTFRQHPLFGEAILLGIPELKKVGQIIRAQHECFDGSGFPDSKASNSISTAAKILTIVRDYYDSIQGRLIEQALDSVEALKNIDEQSGKSYDPDIVKVFKKVLPRIESIQVDLAEHKLETHMLLAGMVLARDLTTEVGTLLLSKGSILQESSIETLINLEAKSGNSLQIYVEKEVSN